MSSNIDQLFDFEAYGDTLDSILQLDFLEGPYSLSGHGNPSFEDLQSNEVVPAYSPATHDRHILDGPLETSWQLEPINQSQRDRQTYLDKNVGINTPDKETASSKGNCDIVRAQQQTWESRSSRVYESSSNQNYGSAALSRQYVCPVCDVSFTNRRIWGKHMRDEHNVQGFECEYCKTPVSRHDNLKVHWRSCKAVPADKRPAVISAPSSTSVSGKRRRVTLRDIQAKPVSPPAILTHSKETKPSSLSPTGKKRSPPRTTRLEQNLWSPKKPAHQRDAVQVPTAENLEIESSARSRPATAVNHLTENNIELLRTELIKIKEDLAMAKDECEVWKIQYLQLKQQYRAV